jgi:Tfp pilus assembly PilM family ATPase
MARRSTSLAAAPPSLAVEIASRRITVLEMGRSAGGPVVTAHGSEPLPPGAVTPALTGTNIAQVPVVATALRKALERAGLKAARRAALIVPDSVARVSLLTFEQVPQKSADLDQLVKWQLKKHAPFPIEEAQVCHFRAYTGDTGTVIGAVCSRRDVIAQYEAVTDAVGMHAGVVDLASMNVMNAIMAAGAAPQTDWLLVCLAPEGTALAILRGSQLMFYRHRTAVDSEPLTSLVHQTAMYHEDRLGGSRFSRVWIAGGASEAARQDVSARLGVPVESVDIRPAASLQDREPATPELLDALAAGVGILLRERKVA